MQILYYLCIITFLGNVLTLPVQNRTGLVENQKHTAQASDKSSIASGNVYGTDAESGHDGENTDNSSANNNGSGEDGTSNQDSGNDNQKNNQRGYNQGYSYNTGIKPYTTGYTYYQPFGDAAKNQQSEQGDGENSEEEKPLSVKVGKVKKIKNDPQQQIPVDLSNIFDDNGIPNLDNLKLPPPPKGVKVQPLKFEVITTTTPRPIAANFDGFDFNQLMGGSDQNYRPQKVSQQPIAQQGDNMFDFAPPGNANFDFAPNGQSSLGQGDQQLMMGGDGPGNSNNPTNNGNGNNFGFGDQQVPSEIVNLNNAFGAGPNNNGGSSDDLSNIVLGNMAGQQQQQPQQPMMDFGEFGSAAQDKPEQAFPFDFNF